MNPPSREILSQITPPIDRLPPDILVEIFHLASAKFLAMYESRNSICAVSHSWREIALSSPGLWTEVNVNINILYPPVYLLRLWLERSHNALLNINFATETHPSLRHVQTEEDHWRPKTSKFLLRDEIMIRYAMTVLPVLVEHIRRWKSFRFRISFHFMSETTQGRETTLLATLPFQDAVRLEVLKMKTSHIDFLTGLEALRAVVNLPSLRRLDWEISQDTLEDAQFSTENPFPWPRLKYVSLDGNTSQVAPIICRCTSAITLDLYLMAAFPVQRQPQTTYSLHELKVLSLQCMSDGFRLLSEMNCPNLEVLHIVVLSQDNGLIHEEHLGEYPDLWDHLHSFLDNSNHKLRILCIDDCEGTIPLEMVQDFFLRPNRIINQLYGMTMSLDCYDGFLPVSDTLAYIEINARLAKSSLPTPLLRRRDSEYYNTKYLHVGWIREELAPYVEECGCNRDMDISKAWNMFEKLLRPKNGDSDGGDLDYGDLDDEDSDDDSDDETSGGENADEVEFSDDEMSDEGSEDEDSDEEDSDEEGLNEENSDDE